jgi:RND family efflux transporter MFP subunit
MRKLLGPLGLLLAGALVGAGCSSQHDDQPRLGEVNRLPRLETMLPARTSLKVTSELAATVDAWEKADLFAQVRGVVKTIPDDVDIGRRVRQGEELVTLDIPDLVAERENKKALLEQSKRVKEQATEALNVARHEVKEAQAQLKRYEADLENRELRFQRLARLAKTDTVQQQLADEARIDRDAAQAALTANQAQILTKQAREAAAQADLQVSESRIKVATSEVEKLNVLVGFGTIRAPFDGIITKRWVDRGATVGISSGPLLTVMRTDVVRVILDVPERDVPLIRVAGKPSPADKGNEVELTIPALKDVAPQGFTGEVQLMASALDPATRTMRTEVHLANKHGYLRPQMTGSAKLVLGERKDVLTVPSSALVRSFNKIMVYYLADLTGEPPQGVVRKVAVEFGLDDGRRVEIRKGLAGTERVITKGAGVVRSGDHAIAVPARQAEAAP